MSSAVVAPDLTRVSVDDHARVTLTTSCRDCDDLPKVDNAGQVVTLDDGSRVQVMHNGVVVEAGGYFGDWMSEIIRTLRGHHEPQEELAFAHVLARLASTGVSSPTVIELGSFWAYYSLWFLHEFPEGRVLAMEPDPDNLDLGRRNFALNGRTGTFLQGVIGPRPGELTSFVSEIDGHAHPVRQYDLATLMESGDLQHVDLLLCDIQGGEQFFFEHARDLLLAGAVRFAVISTHHHSISGDPLTHQKLLRLFHEMGAHVVVEHTVGESFSGDGLIVVSFDAAADKDLVVTTSRARQSNSLFGALEYDLARVMTERDECHESQRELSAELERVRGTRLWRWSALPRQAYARLRSGRS